MRAAIILVLAAAAVTFEALPAANSAAEEQGQRSGRKFGPGVCGPIDPTYIRMAEETGGQVAILSPDELTKPGVTMTPDRGGAILIARGEGARTYSLPIDSSVTHVVFTAWFDGQGGALSVVFPDGMPVQGRDTVQERDTAREPDTAQERNTVQDTMFNCGRIVRIDAPARGSWQLQVAPTNQFWLRADATSALSLRGVELQQVPAGEPRSHRTGRPVIGRPTTLSLTISSASGLPAFELVSLDGQRIREIELESAGEPDSFEESGEARFSGTVDLPGGAFRVLVRGTDNGGAAFQRVSDLPFRAEAIEVIPPAGETLTPGSVHPVRFIIRNLGPAVQPQLMATSGGNVLPVEPPALALEHGAEGLATVRLTVPPAATGRVDVFLTAEASGESPTMNYARKEFIVRAR